VETQRFKQVVLTALLVASAAIAIACNKTGADTRSAAASDGKIPITTKSEEAKSEYLAGRDLSERLLGNESLRHFDKALELDPAFATAELARANNSPTAKEFFAHQLKASMLANQVSDGEKLLILAGEAGSNGEVVKQKDYLEKAVAAYPKLDQFPSPQPLTAEQIALAEYAKNFPKEARLVAQAQEEFELEAQKEMNDVLESRLSASTQRER